MGCAAFALSLNRQGRLVRRRMCRWKETAGERRTRSGWIRGKVRSQGVEGTRLWAFVEILAFRRAAPDWRSVLLIVHLPKNDISLRQHLLSRELGFEEHPSRSAVVVKRDFRPPVDELRFRAAGAIEKRVLGEMRNSQADSSREWLDGCLANFKSEIQLEIEDKRCSNCIKTMAASACRL